MLCTQQCEMPVVRGRVVTDPGAWLHQTSSMPAETRCYANESIVHAGLISIATDNTAATCHVLIGH